MNLLLTLLTITITLVPKRKVEPWANCDKNICIVENPSKKKSVKFYFTCGEEYKPFSVVIAPSTQDQVIVDDEKAWCNLDYWEYK